jgi:hypothetical protein
MSRNLVVVGFGSLIVGAGAAALVLWLFVPKNRPTPGPGSPVRVSGGSITLISSSNWSCDSGTPSSCTKLSTMLPVKSDTPVQASHVQQQPGQQQGNPFDVTYPPAILGSWVVMVVTKDSNGSQHGVTISNEGSTATAELLNGSGHFEQSGPHWKYKSAAQGCPNCEFIKIITVNTGSSADTWYCNDQSGHCDVNIGNMH